VCSSTEPSPSRANGIKSEGMRAKHEGKTLVERNDYATYTMNDVPTLPDYKVVLPTKGMFNGVRAHYNIRTDTDLGVGWAALRRVACGCVPCKEQLNRPWVPSIDVAAAQPRYWQNEECALWPSYEGANNWKICELVPKKKEGEKGARASLHGVLNALEALMSLMIREGKVGAIGTADEASMGYYLVKWLSEPYTMQEDTTDGMSGTIGAGKMVVDALYFNRVERAPFWYTQSGVTTIAEVVHVLRTG